MTNFALVRGRALRVTRLDGCGSVVLGPDSVVVTEGFISVGLTANTEEGETISVTNAAGNVCILDEPTPKFTGYSVEVAFCGVDPDLFSLMTGQEVVLSADGTETVGVRINSKTNLGDKGFALEMWSNVPIAACDSSGSASFGYFLVPFIKGGVLGDFTVENGAINFTMTGARSKDGTEWADGPYNVVRDEDGNPGPLNTPLDSGDHLHLEVTTVAPPSTSTAGAQALGVVATSGVAGTPGTTNPSNSYAPLNLATIGSLTASPTTAWTSGQSIILRDGSRVHWTGTAWASGPA